MRALIAAIFLVTLTSCYPDLDWREIHSEEGRFSVLLPSKPQIENRPLATDRPDILMHQWSARARSTAFAIGFADLSGSDISAHLKFREALVRNISGRVIGVTNVSTNGIAGDEAVAEGRVGDAAVKLRLRTFSLNSRLYQLAVLGPTNDFRPDEVDTFFLSFKFVPGER